MNVGKVMLPVGGVVLGAAVSDLGRKPGTSGAGRALVGALVGLLVGLGFGALLPSTVSIVAGRRYRVSSPMPSEADKPAVFVGLAAAGAIVVGLGPVDLVYELTAEHTKTIALGRDAFTFAEPITGRDVQLTIAKVEELPE